MTFRKNPADTPPPGPNRVKFPVVRQGEGSHLLPDIYSFSEVVDQACEKLMDRQVQYSLRKIREMDELLSGLEKELDNFLSQKDKKQG